MVYISKKSIEFVAFPTWGFIGPGTAALELLFDVRVPNQYRNER